MILQKVSATLKQKNTCGNTPRKGGGHVSSTGKPKFNFNLILAPPSTLLMTNNPVLKSCALLTGACLWKWSRPGAA